MKTKQLVINALCIALNIVLSNMLALSLGPIKLSFSGLPVILAAILFGPADGLIVGFFGGLVGQLIGPYGISVTTPLWIAPAAFLGFVVGDFNRQFIRGKHKPISLCAIILMGLVVDTSFTTIAMRVDCFVYHYSFAVYSPYIVWRYVADIIKAPIYSLLVPHLVKAIKTSARIE